jgi:hypothetical protein
LVWEATGKPEFSHSKETFRDPDLGIKIRSLIHGRQVDATATGTVVKVDPINGNENFTPEPSDTATIQKESDATLIIEKTP